MASGVTDTPNKVCEIWKQIKKWPEGTEQWDRWVRLGSWANVADRNFNDGLTVDELLEESNYDNCDINDVFHAYLSKLLYENDGTIKDQCNIWGFNKEAVTVLEYSPFGKSQTKPCKTQAAIIKQQSKGKKKAFIAFRGTEPTELGQWCLDAGIKFISIDYNQKTRDNGVLVHTGFHKALGLDKNLIDGDPESKDISMIHRLLEEVKKLEKDGYNKISITGHSLGGALASLFSYVLLHTEDYEKLIYGVYTYGQPAVGNKNYANELKTKLGNRYHRWINYNDIVAVIPPFGTEPIIEDPKPQKNKSFDPSTNNGKKSPPQFTTKSADDYRYYHAGLIFKMDEKGFLPNRNEKEFLLNQNKKGIESSPFKVETPSQYEEGMLWDHHPCEYARKIKNIFQNPNN